MELVLDARIKGGFYGWKPGSVFMLDQGNLKKWQQVDDRHEFASAFRPKAKLFRDGAQFYLEVEGMGDMVEVKRA
jgi:hypothetical protein